MAHFLPPEHVRQVNKLEWPYKDIYNMYVSGYMNASHVLAKNTPTDLLRGL